MMNRSELLSKVPTLVDLNKKAVELAEQLQTDEQVAAHIENASTDIARFKKLRATALGAGATSAFMAGAVFVRYIADKAGAPSAGFASLLLGMCFGLLAHMVGLALSRSVFERLAYGEALALLGPVAGTDFCDVGVQVLETGGPLPRTWRDLALQERSELRVFDIQIMVALGERHQAEVSATVRKAQLADSCRKLHDVASQT